MYPRNKYLVTLKNDEGISSTTGATSYYYGAQVEISAKLKSGYLWKLWTDEKGNEVTKNQTYIFTMPAENLTFVATTNKYAKVTVKYIDQNTQDSIADSITIEGYIGKDYTTIKKEIDGYTYQTNTNNTSGTMNEVDIEVIYYYAKTSGVVIKYVDQNTNEEISERISIDGFEGKEYTTDYKTIDGYKYLSSSENTSGSMTRETIIVTYYYAKDASLTVRYIDKNTEKDLMDPIVEDGYEGKEYETEQKEFEGYTYLSNTENTEGSLSSGATEVIYYYAKTTSVTVNYVDSVNNIDAGEKVVIEGYEGKEYTTEEKQIDGYVLLGIVGEAKGTMTAEPIEITYNYAKASTVTARYIDMNTNEILAKEEIIDGYESKNYTTTRKVFDGYVLVDIEAVLNTEKKSSAADDSGDDDDDDDDGDGGDETDGKSTNEDGTDESKDTAKDSTSKEATGNNQDNDTTSTNKNGSNQDGTNTNVSDNQSGNDDEKDDNETVDNNSDSVNNGNTSNTEDTDENSNNNEISVDGEDEENSKESSEIKSEAEENNDAEDDVSEENEADEAELGEASEDDKNDESNNANSNSAAENNVNNDDENNNANSNEITENDNEEVSNIDLNNSNNKIENTATDEQLSESGTMQATDIIVTYKYAKESKITIQYIDKATGKALIDATIIDGYESKDYSYELLGMPGYIYANSNSYAIPTSGKMSAGNTNVILYYLKESKVIIRYIDMNSGKEIAESVSYSGVSTYDYDVTEDQQEIAGYVLVKDSANTTGAYSNDETEVVYYYAKKVKVTLEYVNPITGETESKEYEGFEGKNYNIEIPEYDGYSLENVEGKLAGIYGSDNEAVRITYRAVKEPVVKPATEEIANSSDTGSNNPKTGDTLTKIIGVIALAGMGYTVLNRKKNARRTKNHK